MTFAADRIRVRRAPAFAEDREALFEDTVELPALPPPPPEPPITVMEPEMPAEQRGHAVEATESRVPLAARPKPSLCPEWVEDIRRDPKGSGRHLWRLAVHHLVYLGPALLRVLVLAGRGIVRGVSRAWAWVADHEATHLRLDAVRRRDKRAFADIRRQQKDERIRRSVILAGAVLAVCATFALLALLPLLLRWVAIGATVWALAQYGKRTDPGPADDTKKRPDPPQYKPTPETFYEAFAHAGIEGVACVGHTRRVADGWEQVIELPKGKVTFDDAAKARKKIAGNLDRTAECLFLEPVKGKGGSERKVKLWVTEQDPMTGPLLPSPLLDPKVTVWDLWKLGVPFGRTCRGELISLPLLWTSLLVGAQPRVGKTFSVFEVAGAAALDPYVKLIIADFKNGGDYDPLRPVCDIFITGWDSATAKRLLDVLLAVLADVKERNPRFAKLPTSERREGKITYELAHDPSAGFQQIVVIVDELQNALEDAVHGDAIRQVLVDLSRAAPSQAVMLVLATQRPTRELLGDLRSFMGARFALSVQEEVDSRMILGNDHVAGVVDASLIPKAKKGVGYLSGGEDSTLGDLPAQMIRTCGIDVGGLEEIARRAVAARRAAGTLAEPESTPEPAQAGFVEAVEAVFGPNEDRLHLDTVACRLGESWGCEDGRRVAGLLRAAGVEPQARMREAAGGPQKIGVSRWQLTAATTDRAGNGSGNRAAPVT